MRIALFSFVVSALILSLAAAPGPSQTVTVGFAMPQNRDPSKLTFIQFGKLYTHTDGTAPGDNQGDLITGSILSTVTGGLELHGDIPSFGGGAGGTTPVTEVDFYTTYTGTLTLVPTSNVFGFAPWSVGTTSLQPGYAQGFSFFKTTSAQADLNLGAYYALFTAVPDDPTDVSFPGSTFAFKAAIHPADVPEPGTFALLGGLCLSGCVLWRRR